MDRRQRLFRIRIGQDYCRMSVQVSLPRGPALVALLTGALTVASSTFSAEIGSADRRSDYEFMSRDTQAMQDDDSANPGMLWVIEGETLWKAKAGEANKSCADCHGEVRDS